MTEPDTDIVRHAEPPWPLVRFTRQPENREKLKAIVREPAFIAAINFLCEQDRVRPEHLNSTPDQVLIRKAAFHAGVASVYERLKDLTLEPAALEPTPAWDHLTLDPDIQ